MKTNNKKKIVVSTLALAMGAALAGSISGSVAWYQYSTRATASFIGASAHCTHNLQVSLDGTDGSWKNDFITSEIRTKAIGGHTGQNFQPVTPAATVAADGALPTTAFKANPQFGLFDYTKWADATASDYLQFDLYFRVLDVNGETTPEYRDLDVYLPDLTIEAAATDGVAGTDFSEAIRIHVQNVRDSEYALLAKEAGDTVLGAKLDLNNDGKYDRDVIEKYEWQSGYGTETEYGNKSLKETAETWTKYTSADDSGFDLVPGSATSLGKTGTDGADPLHLRFTIWLEGWAKLANGNTGNKEESDTSVWDVAKYIGNFNIGMRFAVVSHDDSHV